MSLTLVHSPQTRSTRVLWLHANAGMWFRQILPPGAHVDAWIAACAARPALACASAKDAKPA